MKTLSLDFDTTGLSLSKESPDKEMPTAPELSKRVLFLFVKTYAEQTRGLTKADRGLYYQFRPIIENAVKDNLKEAEFPDDVFGFIRKIFRDVRLPFLDNTVEFVEKNVDAVVMK